MSYKQYRRKQVAELADWTPDFDMSGVSVSEEDNKAGSPKEGDKIARNPVNHNDRWLVAAAYFKSNFEEVLTNFERPLRLDGKATDHIWAMEDQPGYIGLRMDSGDSGTVYLTRAQAEEVVLTLETLLDGDADADGHVQA